MGRRLIEGIRERIDVHGRSTSCRTTPRSRQPSSELLEAGVEAIGVCLLWSFANPASRACGRRHRAAPAPDVFLTLSHEIAPIVGEYERTSTVALNARLGPVVGRYLEALADGLAEQGFDGHACS